MWILSSHMDYKDFFQSSHKLFHEFLNLFRSITWLKSDTSNSIPLRDEGIKIKRGINTQHVHISHIMLLSDIYMSHLLVSGKSSPRSLMNLYMEGCDSYWSLRIES